MRHFWRAFEFCGVLCKFVLIFANMTDASDQPLRIPESFESYARKRRLDHLFQRMCEELLVNLPSDPLQFLVDFLARERLNPEPARIIVSGDEHDDAQYIATILAVKTRAVIVDRTQLTTDSNKTQRAPRQRCAEILANCVLDRLARRDCTQFGWILVGIPVDRQEAICLQEAGILADHVVFLHKHRHQITNKSGGLAAVTSEQQQEDFERERLRQMYSQYCMTFDVTSKPVETIAAQVLQYISWRGTEVTSHPTTIVLVGLPYSGCRTHAARLSQKLGLIHVHCGRLISQHIEEKTDDGIEADRFLRQGLLIPDHVVFNILERRLQEGDCRRRGWLVTGYPRNLYQAVLLFNQHVFPAKIIHLQTDQHVCVARAASRHYDPASGALVRVSTNNNINNNDNDNEALSWQLASHLRRHHDDQPSVAKQLVQSRNYQLQLVVRLLCGHIATVDGGGSIEQVYVLIERAISAKTPRVF